jgi:hypothetical protein
VETCFRMHGSYLDRLMNAAEYVETFARTLLIAAGLVALGICLGYPAAGWIGGKFAAVLSCLPTERFVRPEPAFGIPATLAIAGDFTGAMESYERLMVDHPAEKQIYFRMLEIALGPLHATDYAEDVLRRGLENLPDEKVRGSLVRHYEALRHGESVAYLHLPADHSMTPRVL